MVNTFHLRLDAPMLEGATLAIVPGDLERVEKIASLLDEPRFLAAHREFTSWLGYVSGVPVIVTSTGIGGPSTSIAVEELAQLGVRTFVRIGTTGSIQPNIQVGDLIVTTGAVRLDGASTHFAPPEFPAVADFVCTNALVAAAEASGSSVHVGVSASTDTFYPGQERYDTFSGRVVRKFRGSAEEWQSMGVLNFEMEAATLLTMSASSGLRAGCVLGVIVSRSDEEIPDPDVASKAAATAVTVGVEAVRMLIAKESA